MVCLFGFSFCSFVCFGLVACFCYILCFVLFLNGDMASGSASTESPESRASLSQDSCWEKSASAENDAKAAANKPVPVQESAAKAAAEKAVEAGKADALAQESASSSNDATKAWKTVVKLVKEAAAQEAENSAAQEAWREVYTHARKKAKDAKKKAMAAAIAAAKEEPEQAARVVCFSPLQHLRNELRNEVLKCERERKEAANRWSLASIEWEAAMNSKQYAAEQLRVLAMTMLPRTVSDEEWEQRMEKAANAATMWELKKKQAEQDEKVGHTKFQIANVKLSACDDALEEASSALHQSRYQHPSVDSE